MSSPPPTKPPRGVKQGKETSGLLMSVIRTLSASETNEQREKERAKLEKEYKKSDARLDELVAIHAQEIMDVMHKFTQVSEALATWGTHSEAASARLAACRGLLRLRRDDLRRLWMDARTHHHALRMLTDIERVVVSERETVEALGAGRVLSAAHTLRAALDTCRAALPAVTALAATTAHLQAKRRELLDVAVKRISGAVYAVEPAFTRRASARRNAALLLSQLTKTGDIPDTYLQDITPEFEASLSEDDKTFETTVMISLEALGVMEQLKEAAEKFKVNIQTELLEVISTISRRIIDEGDVEMDADVECEEDGDIVDTEGVTETGRPLARLVTCLGEEFRACGARNKRLLQLWRATMQKYQVSDSCLHTEQNYWSAVQQVLQLLLTEYLEIESVTLAASRASGPAAAVELRLSDYFARKKPPRRQTKLFTLSAPMTGSPRATTRRHNYPLVCRPDPSHLHAVLPALHALCADIEPVTGGGECSLRAFITDYVRSGESERLASAARAAIEQAARAPNAWRERARVQGEGMKGERPRVIFAWCVTAWRAVRAAALAARRCGACGGALAAQAPHHAVAQLAAACRHGHSRLCPAPGASSSRAAYWLADDDIVRFLQALPNWKLVTTGGHMPKTPSHYPMEPNQAYEREAEILGSSLGDGALTREEIIADVNTLADLAVMCESMDWLSANIRTIPAIVSAPSAGGSVKLSDKYLSDISSAALIFDEIAHQCLLMLHLELRIECFHYLGQEESDSAAGGAAQLAHALLAFHEQVHNVLAPARLAYILNGLGEMMSAAVVWRWQYSARGAADWESRLATLRHCLAALQLPHSGLHRAHAYLHLLSSTQEEIIASVREKGAQFSGLEYLNAFKVLGARQGISEADMTAYLRQLSVALCYIGVTEIIASVREKGAQFSELEYLNAFKVLGARQGISEADMNAHLQQLSAALYHVGVTV